MVFALFWNTRYRHSAPPGITSITGSSTFGSDRRATRSPTLNIEAGDTALWLTTESAPVVCVFVGTDCPMISPVETLLSSAIVFKAADFVDSTDCSDDGAAPKVFSSRPRVSASRYTSVGGMASAERCAHLLRTVWRSFTQVRPSRGRLRALDSSYQF